MDFFSISGAKGNLKKHFETITKKEKTRGSHAAGVGAMGYAVFEPDDRMPVNDFFKKGRVYEVRARHSNSPGKWCRHFPLFLCCIFVYCARFLSLTLSLFFLSCLFLLLLFLSFILSLSCIHPLPLFSCLSSLLSHFPISFRVIRLSCLFLVKCLFSSSMSCTSIMPLLSIVFILYLSYEPSSYVLSSNSLPPELSISL